MGYEEIIFEHYRKEAEECGLGSESTMRDHFVREVETNFIKNEVNKILCASNGAPKILEIGCGNGFLLLELSRAHPLVHFHGLEFTPELFNLALDRKLENVEMRRGDCLKMGYESESFDAVISERVLINLLDSDDQQLAVSKIYKILKPGGTYVMVEAYAAQLGILNKARREFLLDEINPSHHNLYLDDSILDFMDNLGFHKNETEIKANALSTHFFISRVLHEVVRKEGSPVRNTEFVRFFDMAFPQAIGDYSPIRFHSFKKQVNPQHRK